MNTTSFEQFEVMNTEVLASIEGGGDELGNTAGSAIVGGIVGFGLCSSSIVAAPFAGACAYIGAKFGAVVISF